MKTMEEARAEVMRAAEGKGTACPCCDQFVKLYKRKLNSSMAHGLLHVYRYFKMTKSEWLHFPKFFTEKKICSSNDGGLLRHWGLVTPMIKDRKDGSWRNGYYKLTQLGTEFVQSKVSVPKYVYLYNQNVFGFSDGQKYPKEDTTIADSLGEKFNYRKLMDDE
jgi:hypothetical protein